MITHRLLRATILLLSVGASAGAEASDPRGPETGERARPAERAAVTLRRMLYHLSEGSEIFPLDWLAVLKSVETGEPFLDHPERFGLIPDPQGDDIPGPGNKKSPIGLTIEVPRDVRGIDIVASTIKPPDGRDLGAMRMVGVNCAACHVGMLRYKGKDRIIDGAPNMFDLDAFYQELFLSAAATVMNPKKLDAFLSDLGELKEKSEISKILVECRGDIASLWEQTEKLSLVEQAIVNRLRGLFGGAEGGGELERADTMRFIILARSRNPGAEDLKELVKADLMRAVPVETRTQLEKLLQENPLSQGAVLPRVGELLEDLGKGDQRDLFLQAYGLLRGRLDFLRTLKSLHTAGDGEREYGRPGANRPGPGRIDALGNARRLVFNKEPKIPLNSPVNYPHLWGMGRTEWFHWDGSTNSLMERNIGQALALGAIVDKRTGATTVLYDNLHTLELLCSNLAPPSWPKDFRPVDTASEQYRRGAALYAQHCTRCHDRQEHGRTPREGSVAYALEEIGTDPNRAKNFAKPLGGGESFTRRLQAVFGEIKRHADYKADLVDASGRIDLRDDQIRWVATEGYVARPLVGIWATAPYLHNGSVPTLDDLLKKPDKRPVCFPVGHREYDPEKLGYVSEFEGLPQEERERFFVYDTRTEGNSNRGHDYGTELTTEDRRALLEYLKVMEPPSANAGGEKIPSGETRDIEELKRLQLELMRTTAVGGKPTDRGQHPKHHGFVVARFRVLKDLPSRLKVGLFSKPDTYPAVIRFSSTGERDDALLDNHGMAIKLLGVKGKKLLEDEDEDEKGAETQDFVLLDHPLFFSKDVSSLVRFSHEKEKMMQKGLVGTELLEALRSSCPDEVRLLVDRKKHIQSPLATEYFSTTPYLFGETAVKYSAKPEPSENYLREVMVEQLATREQPTSRKRSARFGFYVQRQGDPEDMPIEDPTREWTSEWERVATIEIDAQDFNFPKMEKWGNELSYTPWHALKEHQPLGGINRARKEVYLASSKLRHENLHVPRKEPTVAEIPVKK